MPPSKGRRGGGGILFLSRLSFCPSLWNFNLANIFWTVSALALIFHMSIPCDKAFPWVPLIFYPLTLEFDPFFENFNLGNNFWTVSTRALIFHMSIPCDKAFPWVPTILILWSWPWSLTSFLKILTLLRRFELWVLEFIHFTWIFVVAKSFSEYQHFSPCDLDLGIWPIFEKH